MTEDQPNAPAAPAPSKKADPLVGLKKLVDAMSTEQRQRCEQAGIVIPSGDISDLSTGKYTWGLRCTACNNMALFFVGKKWTLDDGAVVDEPPPLAQNRIMWTQALPPDEIDRHTPRCQHCRVTVPMNSDNSFSRERQRVQRVKEFVESRDKSHDPKFVREQTRKLTREAGQYASEVSGNYTNPQAVGKVSKSDAFVEALSTAGVGSIEELNAIADAHGVTVAVKKGFPR